MCEHQMKLYDTVNRIVKYGNGRKEIVRIKRHKCSICGEMHRELPSYILPFKHYHRDIIEGFINGQLSIFDLDYEDYPCEKTTHRWSRELHTSL